MNPKDLKQFISACDLCDQAPLISGTHGVGKSDSIKQYATEANLHRETLILSLMDEGDLLGIPRTAEVGGQTATVWAAPSWYNRILNAAWPIELLTSELSFKDDSFREVVLSSTTEPTIGRDRLNELYCVHYNVTNNLLQIHLQNLVTYNLSKRSVLFLDELNRSSSGILNTSLQLVLDRRLNDHILPIVDGKPTLVVAAINPADGDYTTMEMDPALLDRFVFGEATADATSWLEWARGNNVAQVVRDFISEHPDRLVYNSKDGKSSATPRSWTSLARTMDQIDNIPVDVQFQLMKGQIGQELASQFLAYFNNYFKVIKMGDVEALIEKKGKRTKDVQKLAAHVTKQLKDQETIQKNELAEQFYEKYISAETAEDMKPLLVYLESLELEICAGFLKTKRTDDYENYMKLAKFDGELNNKNLFKKILTKAK